jgi:glutathionylspermidine synthase
VSAVPEVRALSIADPLAQPALARELAHRYLLWDTHVSGARRVDLHPLLLPDSLHRDAVAAAEGVVAAVSRAARLALADDGGGERARYRLGPDTLRLAAASHAGGDDASLMRVDLLLGSDGTFRVCELNADCPGGHNEATGLPRLARAAGFCGGENPTSLLDSLVDRITALASRTGRSGRGGSPLAAASDHDGRLPRAVGLLFATAYAEDLQICALVQRGLARRGVRALLLPPTAPRLERGALVAGGCELSALYRFFPIEAMEGQRNIGDLAEAVSSGKVRTISSFSQIFAQSKLAMARAWSRLGELPEHERAAVERHLPLTLDLADVPSAALVSDRRGWVLKRSLGRVGDDVFVGELFSPEEWPEVVAGVIELHLQGESWIAQRFVPQRAVATPWGDRLVTLGAYVLDGRFKGYFARLSEASHVSHDAMCVPVFTVDDASAPEAAT